MHRISSFPTVRDLPALAPEDASRALAALRSLVESDLATVYTRPQHHKDTTPPRWNVWSEIQQRRIELPTWAAAWVATQHSPTGGDAA